MLVGFERARSSCLITSDLINFPLHICRQR